MSNLLYSDVHAEVTLKLPIPGLIAIKMQCLHQEVFNAWAKELWITDGSWRTRVVMPLMYLDEMEEHEEVYKALPAEFQDRSTKMGKLSAQYEVVSPGAHAREWEELEDCYYRALRENSKAEVSTGMLPALMNEVFEGSPIPHWQVWITKSAGDWRRILFWRK